MTETLVIVVSDAVLVGLIGTMGYFFKREVSTNDEKHRLHFTHSSDLSLHETDRDRLADQQRRELLASALKEHTDKDDQRFDRVDGKLDRISDKVDDVLKEIRRPG